MGQAGRDSAVSPYVEVGDLAIEFSDTSPAVSMSLSAYTTTCALFSDAGVGRVRCWGYSGPNKLNGGATGDIGTGTGPAMRNLGYLAFSSPSLSAVSVSVGFEAGCAVFTDGTLRCWGQVQHGQHGVYAPVASVVLPPSSPAIAIGGSLSAAQVTCNPNAKYCCLITTAGSSKCFGVCTTAGGYCLGTNNGSDGDTVGWSLAASAVIPFPVSAGLVSKMSLNRMAIAGDVTGVLFASGKIAVFGDIGASGMGGFAAMGTWGSTPASSTAVLPFISFGPTVGPAIDLSIGFSNACALFASGGVRCWGGGSTPRGFGPAASSPVEMAAIAPVNPFPAQARTIAVGSYTVCAAFDTGYSCVGDNLSGQAGLPQTSPGGRSVAPVSSVPPIPFVGKTPISASTLAITAHGQYGASVCVGHNVYRVSCWGNSLGDNVVTFPTSLIASYPQQLPEDNLGGVSINVNSIVMDVDTYTLASSESIVALFSYAAGADTDGGGVMCVKTGAGKIYCFGKNRLSASSTFTSCQLHYGAGTALQWPQSFAKLLVTTPTCAFPCLLGLAWPASPANWMSVAVGFEHMCGRAPYLTNGAAIFCWGDNGVGELGDPGANTEPKRGCTQEPGRAPLWSLSTIGAVEVYAGFRRTCAIFFSALANARYLACWGLNTYGEALNTADIAGTGGYTGTSARPLAATPAFAAVTLPPAGAGQTWVPQSVSIGYMHTCVLMIKTPAGTRDVMCFGSGKNYRLGLGTSTADVVLSAATVPIWLNAGINAVLAPANPNLAVEDVSAGYSHTCLLLRLTASATQFSTMCFGSNEYGQTGSILGASVDVPLLANTKTTAWQLTSGYVMSVVAGRWVTCVMVFSGAANRVICIGANHAGVLATTGTPLAGYHLGSNATAAASLPSQCTGPAVYLTGLSVLSSLSFTPPFSPSTASFSAVVPAVSTSFVALAASSGTVWIEDNQAAPSNASALQGACFASVRSATLAGPLASEGSLANLTVGVLGLDRLGPASYYSLTVRRAYSDAALVYLADASGLIVTGPAAPRIFTVPFAVTSIPPVTASCNATTLCKVSLLGSPYTLTTAAGVVPSPLPLGATVYALSVMPEDGPAVDYSFTVLRQDNDASLRAINDAMGLLAFSPGVTQYVINLSSAVPSLASISATCTSRPCNLAVSGAATLTGMSGQVQVYGIAVPAGGSAISLVFTVVSEDLSATSTTVVRVRRMLSDASATFTDTSAGAPFVSLSTTSASITPVCGDPVGCTVKISANNSTAVISTTSGVPAVVPLSPGPNVFSCSVQAEDPAVPPRVYTVSIRRGPFPSTDSALLGAVDAVSGANASISGSVVTATFYQAVPPTPNPALLLNLTCRAPAPVPCSITLSPAVPGATCSCQGGARTCLLTVTSPSASLSLRIVVAAEDPLAAVTPYLITLIGAPVVLGVSPGSSPAAPDTVITVRGFDFGFSAPEFSAILLAGVPCVRSSWVSTTTALCRGIPPSGVRVGSLSLVTAATVAAGVGASSTRLMVTPYPPNPALVPVVSLISPPRAEIGTAVTLTLSGKNLRSAPDPVLIVVGDLVCDPTVGNDTVVVCDIKAPGARAPALTTLSLATDEGLFSPATPNFAFTPLASRAVYVSNRAAQLFTREDDDRAVATIALSLGVALSSPVTVVAYVTPATEARVVNPALTFDVSSVSNATLSFTVVGLPDRVRDGAVTYTVGFEVSSVDPLLDRAYIPPVSLTNYDSRPVGLAVSPRTLPLLGGTTATITGINFDTDASFLIGGAPCTNVSVTSQDVAVVIVPGSPTGVETYAALQVVSGQSSGAKEPGVTTLQAVYYNDACPSPGMLGSGSRCRPCPKGGYCPGGERVRPLPGYWNEGERSGWVSECPLGATTCAGCRNDITGEDTACYSNSTGSACIFPYTGRLCGACVKGYFRTAAGTCLLCLSQGEVAAYLVGAVMLWGTLAVCSWRIRSPHLWADIVEIVLALQEAAGIGALIAQGLPPFASSWYRILELVTGDPVFVKSACDGLPPIPQQYLASVGYACALGAPMWLAMLLVKPFLKKRRPGFAFEGLIARGLVTHLVLQYYNILSQSLTILACARTGDGSIRLVPWPHVQCFRGAHIPAFAVAAVLTLTIGVAAPVLYTGYLWKRRAEMFSNLRLVNRFSLLYLGYKLKFRFFFLAEILVMVILSVGKALLQARFLEQIVLVGIVLFAQTVALLITRPFPSRPQLFFVVTCIVTNIAALVVIYLGNTKVLTEKTSRIPTLVIMALVAFGLTGKVITVVWEATEAHHRREATGDEIGAEGSDAGEEVEMEGEEREGIALIQRQRQRGGQRGSMPPSDAGVTEALFSGSATTGAAVGAAASAEGPIETLRLLFTNLFADAEPQPAGKEADPAHPEEAAGPLPGALPLWRVHTIVPRVPGGQPPSPPITSRPPPGWSSGSQPVDVTASLGPVVQELLDSTSHVKLFGKGNDVRGGASGYSRLEVVGVTRLEDSLRWSEMYATAAAQMRRQFCRGVAPRLRLATDGFWEDLMGPDSPRDLDLGEALLFHGTTAEAANLIRTSSTLDERLASSGLFGRGVYLTDSPTKADQYCTPESSGLFTMFLARALLGVPYAALAPLPKDLRLAPCSLGCPGPCPHQRRFDSILGETVAHDPRAYLNYHRELVIFDRRQIFVEFAVTFKRV